MKPAGCGDCRGWNRDGPQAVGEPALSACRPLKGMLPVPIMVVVGVGCMGEEWTLMISKQKLVVMLSL